MKLRSRIILLIFSVTVINNNYTFAQIFHPVHWSYGFKRLPNNEAMLFFKATIDQGWHIYDQNEPADGPTKTEFTFDHSDSYMLTGNVVQPKAIEKFEQAFNMTVHYYERSVIFQQRVKLKQAHGTASGSIAFGCCNAQKCLPPETVQFKIKI